MAFFKFRKAADEVGLRRQRPRPKASTCLRRRARHRLIGAAVLVLVAWSAFRWCLTPSRGRCRSTSPSTIPDRTRSSRWRLHAAAPVPSAPTQSAPAAPAPAQPAPAAPVVSRAGHGPGAASPAAQGCAGRGLGSPKRRRNRAGQARAQAGGFGAQAGGFGAKPKPTRSPMTAPAPSALLEGKAAPPPPQPARPTASAMWCRSAPSPMPTRRAKRA
jgi:DedD protein